MGIIAGAMSGGGGALERVAHQGIEYLSRSQIQKEAADIQEARDARLREFEATRDARRAEQRKGELEYADTLRRKPGMEAAKEIEASRASPVDDLSGTARPKTKEEMADAEEGAYRRQGLVSEAMQVRTTEQTRQRDNQTALDRTADNNRGERQLDLQAKNFDVQAKGAALDRQIKQLTLDNAKRVDELRKEFPDANPARQKEISESIQLLTGKDNDNYLPVPLKDDMGNVTGYKIFDKKRGNWVESNEKAVPKPGDRPPLDTFDKSKRPQVSDAAPAAAPVADALEVGDRNPVGFDQPPEDNAAKLERERIERMKGRIRSREGAAFEGQYGGNI